ncbi:MAG TPA: hypothetical protein V6C90_17870 [Coleofasciculaceae cyanobacterium]
MNLRTRLMFATTIAIPILCICMVWSLIKDQQSDRLLREKRPIRYQPIYQPAEP